MEVTLNNGGATVKIRSEGGSITSWIPKERGEQIFLSSKTQFPPVNNVRGAVPICFPQFGVRGPLPKHGFCRSEEWKLQKREESICDMMLEVKRDDYPHFRIKCVVTIVDGDTLSMDCTAEALRPGETLKWNAVLHPYFTTSDVTKTVVEELERYARESVHDISNPDIYTPGEQKFHCGVVDCLYDGLAGKGASTVRIRRPRGDEAGDIEVTRKGELESFVIWNAGSESGLSDLPGDEWKRYLCVEPARLTHKNDSPRAVFGMRVVCI